VPDQQLPLFSGESRQPPVPGDQAPELTSHAPLRRAIGAFAEHMRRIDFAENTIKSFLGDLSLFARYVGQDAEIGALATQDLQAFMDYLHHGRGVPCTPKSYGRRLTTLKVFFGWLANGKVLPYDPAAPLVHQPAASPLPLILYDEQIERALDASRALMNDPKHPDPRPHLLLNLILQTGIKKSECLNIHLGHFDFSDPQSPAVFIRYQNPRRRHKERKLALERSFPGLLRRYLEVYAPRDVLFPCTGRNLEYVLHRVAQLADLPNGISFEMLRWTCAVRDYRAGMEPEQLRRKLGLSEMAWEETLGKIQALVANPL